MGNLLKKRKAEAAPKQAAPGVFGLRRAMDDLFDHFFHGFDLDPLWDSRERWPGLASFTPRIDITEDDKRLTVTAELPGLEEKDLSVSLADDVLTIKGEKKEETEEKKERGCYRAERSYGSFERAIALPDGLDVDKAAAELKSGVLTVSFPKRPDVQKKRKEISVKTG
jgi:HSP20 family protein